MKTLALVASNSKKSINRKLLEYAAQRLKELVETDVELVTVNDFDAPIYSIDTENESGIPQAAKDLRAKIADADQLLVAYAEHNGSYVAAYKSLFDWMTRLEGKVFAGKPMVIMATSPGPGGAKSVLKQAETSAPFFGAEIKASFSLPTYNETFDAEAGVIKDPDLKAELDAALSTLAAK